MTVEKDGTCEFCGKKRKWLASNSFHGFYCISCIRLNRYEDAECLRDIKEGIKINEKNL